MVLLKLNNILNINAEETIRCTNILVGKIIRRIVEKWCKLYKNN
jgi:hypothetical protein